MQHDRLGEITRESDDGDGVAQVLYGDRTIEFSLVVDAAPFEATVDFAASAAQELERLDVVAKKAAAAELTEKGCSGCKMALPRLEMQVMRDQPEDALLRCENCGRVLVR